MKKVILLFFIFFLNLYAHEFKVASYNVENLFDLEYDGTEYKEYIPHTKYWNDTAYKNKLKNIIKVINDLDAQILALQEIESQKVFDALKNKTNYRYGAFIKKKTSSIGIGLLSDYPIKKIEKIDVDKYDKHSRYILKAIIDIKGIELIIYVNHWRSKRAAESSRIKYALSLKNDIDTLAKARDYIILGDLNSDYNEFISFKYDKKLNDTFGITGINHILNTILNDNLVTKSSLFEDKNSHYNLWLELEETERFSSKFRNLNNTPDNILISDELFDNQGISYIDKSFKVFKPAYLCKDYIKRWNIKNGSGYSDHLPVLASFSTKRQNYGFGSREEGDITKISDLYPIQTLQKEIILKNIAVLYRTKDIAVIKQLNNRAVTVYKPPQDLKPGFIYDIWVTKLDSYFGLKEIKGISKLKKVSSYEGFRELYKDALQIDLFDPVNQNEVVTNLEGIYDKGFLFFDKNGEEKRIKLYFKKGIKKPEDKDKILIRSGHLGVYKSKVQIIIYKNEDYKIY